MHEGHRVESSPPVEIASTSTTDSSSSSYLPSLPIVSSLPPHQFQTTHASTSSMGLFDMTPSMLQNQLPALTHPNNDLPYPLASNVSINNNRSMGLGGGGGSLSWSMTVPNTNPSPDNDTMRLLNSLLGAAQPLSSSSTSGQMNNGPSMDFSQLWPGQTNLGWGK